MKLVISVGLAAIPIFYLLNYFYKKDNLRPEPKGLIFKVFVCGFLSTLIVVFIELLAGIFNVFGFSPLLFHAFEAFIIAGLIEELTKLIIVKKTVYNNIKFDEVMDGIIYTISASLGFAFMENILYVIGGGLTTAVLRGFTAVPMHAFMSGIMGYYIGKAKFSSNAMEEKKIIKKGFFIAVLLHGTYDFFLMLIKVFPDIALILIGLVLLELIYAGKHLNILIKTAKKSDFDSERIK